MPLLKVINIYHDLKIGLLTHLKQTMKSLSKRLWLGNIP